MGNPDRTTTVPALGEAFSGVLEAARLGAEWAWTALYRSLAPAVLGYLRARGARDPDDTLGDVFLAVVRDLPTFQGDERALRAWVLTIAHHRLIDAARYRTRRPVEPVACEVLEAAGPTASSEQEGLEAVELREIQQMIGSLTPDQQSVLLLRILGDLTVDETAAVLGKPPGAVKALQRRGLAAIETRLARQGVTLRAGSGA